MDESVDAAIEKLARKQHGVFSRRQAMLKGASNSFIQRRVRAHRWRRVAPGVYALPGWERTFKQRVMVAVLQLGEGGAASHRCAALLQGLDGVKSAPVEVTSSRNAGARLQGARLRRSQDLRVEDIVIIDGIPTTSITRTLVDLAAELSIDDLECAYEDGVRRGATSLEAIESFVRRVARSGRPGVRGARKLVKIAVKDGKRNGSELETRFFQLLRASGIPLPVRQRFVLRPDGRFAYADYAYDDKKIVFELQGYDGHSSKRHHRRDTERNNMIHLRDYKIYEFTWHHVMHEPDYVTLVVLRALGMETIEYR